MPVRQSAGQTLNVPRPTAWRPTQAEAEAFKIESVEKKDKAKGDADIQFTKVSAQADVEIQEAKAQLKVAEFEANREKEEIIRSMRTK